MKFDSHNNSPLDARLSKVLAALQKHSLWLFSGIIVFLFAVTVGFMELLRNQHDPTLLFNELLVQEDILVLKDWTPRYMVLGEGNVPKLSNTSMPVLTLPNRDAATLLVQERGENTHIVLSYELGSQDLAWLKSLGTNGKQNLLGKKPLTDVEFVAPRLQMSRANLQFQNTIVATRTESGASLVESLEIAELHKNPTLYLIFDLTETGWFGPSQFPIVLARPSATEKLTGFEKLATRGELLADLMTLGFSLMLITFARVLNHAPSVAWLAVYCTARALRIVASYLMNAHITSQQVAVSFLAPMHFGLDLLTALALVGVIAKQVGLALPLKFFALMGGMFYAAFALLTSSFFSARWLKFSTSAADAYSGVVCVLLLCGGILLSLKNSKADDGAEQKSSGVPHGLPNGLPNGLPLGLLLTLVACLLLTWGAAEHLTDILQGRVPSVLSLKKSVVLPLLILAVLWGVNSVTRELECFGEEMKKRFGLLIASVSRINNAASVREILQHMRSYLKEQVFKETGTANEVVLNSWAMGQDGTRIQIKTTLTNALNTAQNPDETKGAGATENLFTGISDPMPNTLLNQDLLSEDDKGLNLRVQSGDQVRGFIHVTGLSRGMLSGHTQMGVAAVLSSVGNAIDKFHTFNGMRILANVELLAFLGLRHASEIRTGLSQSHNLVAVFLDMAGFTAASGRMSGKDLALFTNRFLQEPTRIVQAHQGYIDKYMGDGLFALFKEKSQALAALPKLLAAAKAFNKEQEKVESERVSIRIGANYGEVIVTAQGIDGMRIELTGLSESVNLASRMESGNKALGSLVLVNEGLFEGTREALRVHGGRRLGQVLFAGASTPVAVLELHVSPHKMLPSNFNDFEEAIEMFAAGNRQRAAELFARLKASHPEDTLLNVYLAQIENMASGRFAQPEFEKVLVLQSK